MSLNLSSNILKMNSLENVMECSTDNVKEKDDIMKLQRMKEYLMLKKEIHD